MFCWATAIVLAASSVLGQQGPGLGDSDCATFVLSVLPGWNYPLPIPTGSDTASGCCTNDLSSRGAVSCNATGGITAVNFANVGIKGEVPEGFYRFQSLTSVNISGNPGVSNGLQIFAALPNLQTLDVSGCGFRLSLNNTFRPSLTCNFANTGLCGNAGCNQIVPIPACPTLATGNNDPASFVTPTASTTFYILIGAFVTALLLFVLMCVCCNQRGKIRLPNAAGTMVTLGRNNSMRRSLSRKSAAPSPDEVPTDNEMAMITLSRNGIPRRTFSLPDTRRLQSAEEGALDMSAVQPFVTANAGGESFPVRRAYYKENGDELALTEGDSVVLTKVFRDGWAEGVSKRAGGPALFPLACLGGGVPIVLAERLRVAKAMARAYSNSGATA